MAGPVRAAVVRAAGASMDGPSVIAGRAAGRPLTEGAERGAAATVHTDDRLASGPPAGHATTARCNREVRAAREDPAAREDRAARGDPAAREDPAARVDPADLAARAARLARADPAVLARAHGAGSASGRMTPLAPRAADAHRMPLRPRWANAPLARRADDRLIRPGPDRGRDL